MALWICTLCGPSLPVEESGTHGQARFIFRVFHGRCLNCCGRGVHTTPPGGCEVQNVALCSTPAVSAVSFWVHLGHRRAVFSLNIYLREVFPSHVGKYLGKYPSQLLVRFERIK